MYCDMANQAFRFEVSKGAWQFSAVALAALLAWIVSGGWCPKKCRECVESQVRF